MPAAPSTPTDATPELIAAFFRQGPLPADAEEWLLATGSPLTEATFTAALGLAPARALLDEGGRCVCLWGVIPDAVAPELGNFWLLTAAPADGDDAGVYELPGAKAEAATLTAPFSAVVAVVHPDNERHQAWLDAFDFDHLGEIPVGPANTAFAAFVRQNKETAHVSAASN